MWVYLKYWQQWFTQSILTGLSKFEVSPGLGPLFYDASLLRFVTLHMVSLKCFSFLKKYMEKLWQIFVSEWISLFTAQAWFLRIEGSSWLQLLLSMLHIKTGALDPDSIIPMGKM